MNTQSLSNNSLLYLQSHPYEACEAVDSFELLHSLLQRTVNLLGQRLYELTKNQAELDKIGKAQRALTGTMQAYHKNLATLGDLKSVDLDPPQPQFPTHPQLQAEPEPEPALHPSEPATITEFSGSEPSEPPEPSHDSIPHEHTEPQTRLDPKPPESPSKESSPPTPLSLQPPPLDYKSPDFDKQLVQYEGFLQNLLDNTLSPPPKPAEIPGPSTG